MIKQCAITEITSRSECNPFDPTGFLPLITSNMYSVVNKHNAHIFLQNKIKVCMPRKEYMDETYQHCTDENYFDSYSLDEFIELFIDSEQGFLNDHNGDTIKTSVCIDTAAGHLKKLHEAIRKAKEIHGDSLIIMAGNVASVEAFIELAKTGVDYIRVGIGGGGGCNTTSNTGVGQENLAKLVKQCYWAKSIDIVQDGVNINKVKIVADGISSYIKLCQEKYRFNNNGYAAINKLLFAGANLVMIGGLFAQCIESAGEKSLFGRVIDNGIDIIDWKKYGGNKNHNIHVKYSGMSTQEEQKKYRPDLQNLKIIDGPTSVYPDEYTYTVKKDGEPYKDIKPSEGSVQWIPVRWTLNEWLNGSTDQDEYPYLMGWINSIKSAMSYAGKTKLND